MGVGCIVYGFFGSAVRQPWNDYRKAKSNKNNDIDLSDG